MVVNLFFLRGFGKESLRFFAAFSLVFLVFCVNSVAEGKQSAQTQKLTVKAVQAVKQNQVSYAQSLVSKTGDSLANKIYHWTLFTTMKNAKWDMDLYVRLSRFVQEHPDWPAISKIALLAENVMPQNISNEEAIGWFSKYPPKTPNGMERYIDALMINGRTKEAKTFLENWWASTLISRDQQREIFLKYGKFLTLDAHKKRFDALLSEGHYENARAIGRVLGNGYPELAEARIALAEGKGGATAAVSRVPKKLQNDPGLLYERLHWRRKNNLNMEAMEILHNQPPVAKLRNKEDWWTERHIIIRRMLEQRNYKSAYLLAADHGLDEGTSYAEAQWLAGWLALRYMNKHSEAYSRFTALHEKVKTPVSKARAAYWSGRAAKAMGKKGQAQEWFSSAAQYKSTFYGQLAHAQLSSRMELPRDTVSSLSGSDTGGFGKSELIQAARIFHDAGMLEISGNFLQAFIAQQNSPKAYKYAAEMAVAMGDYNQAVKISKDASSKGYFMSRQSYPVMTNWTRNNNGVELAFVHAIIRQESVFDTHALSSAGAMGLMQLMPGTAKEVAGKLGVAYDKTGLMKRPEYNVRLGSSYLSRLLQRYDGNYAMAAAAYNAGPGRVNQWIGQFGDPRDSKIDLIDWIEMIPISETRNYVQRVLENVYVYRIRLKDIQGQPAEPLHVAFKEKQ